MRLRSVMEPPGALSGLAERAGAGCGVAPGVPCVTKNRSDVYACQCPETLRNSGDIKRRPEMSSDLYVTGGVAGAASSPTVACSEALISADSFSIAATAAVPALRSQ